MTSSLLLPERKGPVTLSEEQLALRRTLLTATDMAAIMGVSNYRTSFDVWLEKTGQAPAYKPSIPARRGQYLEPLVVELYQEQCEDIADIRAGTTIAHPEHKIIGATPDYYIDTTIGTTRLLECKTKTYLSAKTQGLGAQGTDELPDDILVQVQQQMLVTGIDLTHVAVLVDDNLRLYHCEASQGVFDRILEIGYDWWTNHMVKGIQPDSSGSANAKYYEGVKAEFTKTEIVQAEGEMLVALTEYAQLKAEEKRIKKEIEDAQPRLIKLSNGHQKVACELGKLSFSKSENSRSTNWAKVVKEASVPQEIIDKHTKITEKASPVSVRFDFVK